MDEEASEKSSILFKDTQLISDRAKPPKKKKTASSVMIPDVALNVTMVYCNRSLSLQEGRTIHLFQELLCCSSPVMTADTCELYLAGDFQEVKPVSVPHRLCISMPNKKEYSPVSTYCEEKEHRRAVSLMFGTSDCQGFKASTDW